MFTLAPRTPHHHHHHHSHITPLRVACTKCVFTHVHTKTNRTHTPPSFHFIISYTTTCQRVYGESLIWPRDRPRVTTPSQLMQTIHTSHSPQTTGLLKSLLPHRKVTSPERKCATDQQQQQSPSHAWLAGNHFRTNTHTHWHLLWSWNSALSGLRQIIESIRRRFSASAVYPHDPPPPRAPINNVGDHLSDVSGPAHNCDAYSIHLRINPSYILFCATGRPLHRAANWRRTMALAVQWAAALRCRWPAMCSACTTSSPPPVAANARRRRRRRRRRQRNGVSWRFVPAVQLWRTRRK